jgi:hypothetical protein
MYELKKSHSVKGLNYELPIFQPYERILGSAYGIHPYQFNHQTPSEQTAPSTST